MLTWKWCRSRIEVPCIQLTTQPIQFLNHAVPVQICSHPQMHVLSMAIETKSIPAVQSEYSVVHFFSSICSFFRHPGRTSFFATVSVASSVNSRISVRAEGSHIWGRVSLMHFLFCVCVFWVIFWGEIWDSRGKSPQEIAGINTGGVPLKATTFLSRNCCDAVWDSVTTGLDDFQLYQHNPTGSEVARTHAVPYLGFIKGWAKFSLVTNA